jgi:hypothetical protein
MSAAGCCLSCLLQDEIRLPAVHSAELQGAYVLVQRKHSCLLCCLHGVRTAAQVAVQL